MSIGNGNQDFDTYRRQRIRHQKKVSPAGADPGYQNSALRELERVEQKEVRDQQLTREVHEFFSSATRQAATIVERMAHDAEEQADVQVQQEVESFLMDAFARMNTLVVAMLQKKNRGVAEERLVPSVTNIVGEPLDQFRWAGTADLLDKHIGQDPFDTDLDLVRREFLAQVGHGTAPTAGGGEATPMEDHLVAEIGEDEALADGATADDTRDERAAADDGGADEDGGEVSGAAATMPTAAEELERFKEALKSLVRQGTMSRDEARAAWMTRLKSMGAKLVPATPPPQ